MKKRWAAVLLVLLGCALLCAGCGGKEEANDDQAEDNREIEEISESGEANKRKDAPQIKITSGQHMDWYSEDGSVWLLHGEYAEVTVEGEGYENVAAAVNAWSRERADSMLAQGEGAARLEEEESLERADTDYYRYSIFQDIIVARADCRGI